MVTIGASFAIAQDLALLLGELVVRAVVHYAKSSDRDRWSVLISECRREKRNTWSSAERQLTRWT